MNIKDNLEENIEIYAGMTIQKRAIVDVRDCLKPSARLSIYSQYIDKLWPTKPFEKSAVSVASAMRHFYPYGDNGLYSMLARLGKPYAMRYQLEEFQGSTGDITEDDNQAAMRYTNMRLSPLSMELFVDIEKDTINKWYDSYTGKEQYPAVLNSKGYYNICNGSMGLAYAIAASIPQFNLKEVNQAMEKLLLNPDIDDEEIICLPDFATGGILLNEAEVRESLKNGNGHACKLRSEVEYDPKEKALIFTHTPYSVYTNTIMQQLQKIKLSEENPGIINYWDQSTNDACIKVALSKNANPNKVIKYLFKNTSLQYHYGINLTMLDKGKVPKVFRWKEALQSHIDHEKEVYIRGYNFDRKKALARVHILNGYLIIYQDIDTVIQTIKTSTNAKEAAERLKELCHLDDTQVKAILAMKLSQIAKLEIQKIKDEKEELDNQIKWLEEVLNNPKLLYQQMINKWREVAEKFGDPRRTQILNIETEDSEPVEVFNIQLSLTNKNNIFATRTSSLYTQRRGGIGNKLKLDANEVVIETESIESTDKILFFTKSGQFYHCSASEIQIDEKIAIESLIPITNDAVKALAAINEKEKYQYVHFITKNGLIKKSAFSEYNTKRKVGVKALNLDNNDEIVEVLFGENEKIGVLTHNGNLLMFDSKMINSTGRLSRGVTAIKLNDSDYVVSAKIIPNNTQFICSVTEKGLIKQTPIAEFNIQGRATKGSRIQKVDNDYLADFIPLIDEETIIVAAAASCIRIKTKEIPMHSRDTIGAKAIKLRETDKVIQLTKE